MRKVLLTVLAVLSIHSTLAKDIYDNEQPKDTLYTELKTDIVVLSSTKETNSLKNLPAAVSVLSPKNLESLQVSSFKDLSSIVPNYFVADYGSKMTAPVYIRGIGARSGFQTVSMYVDNIPYFNTTAFDTELLDIQRIEVLRGTQGTLYGRNAMGGIINIYTFSPLSYSGTTLKVGGGSYGEFSASASTYQKINSKMGISVGAYYKRSDGYFKNNFTGRHVDNVDNVGGRVKFVWNITDRLSATYAGSFDWLDQGAFPYANIATDSISYNSDSYYKRRLLTNGLALKYAGDGYEINSTTGYQYLNDEMNMDQDYTPRSVFQINQRQKENSISQEVTIKSNNDSWYQWSGGVYGFYDYLHTTPPVYMMKDGVQGILQAMMDGFNAPIIFTDTQIDLDGNYKRPVYGAAIFHQSTFNDIFTKGLSATLGLRLDYEKTKLDYDAYSQTNFYVKYMPSKIYTAQPVLKGKASDDYLEVLPKALIKYEVDDNSYAYLSASRGYKAGGHNIQMFADLLQEELVVSMFDQMPKEMLPLLGDRVTSMLEAFEKRAPVNERISYKPEYSWNYELGGQVSLFDNALTSNIALFYSNVHDVQLTQFISSRGGRVVVNGGKAISKGFEIGLKTRPCNGFYLYANYGFSDAKLKDYKTTAKVNGRDTEVDYSNNYIPFAPRTTFSVGGSMTYDLNRSSVLDRITFDVNYAGTGKIYWEESNTMSQGFYGTLNTRLALEKSIFTIEVWGKNILDRNYYSFVFESMGNHYGQLSKPARWGASLKIKL